MINLCQFWQMFSWRIFSKCNLEVISDATRQPFWLAGFYSHEPTNRFRIFIELRPHIVCMYEIPKFLYVFIFLLHQHNFTYRCLFSMIFFLDIMILPLLCASIFIVCFYLYFFCSIKALSNNHFIIHCIYNQCIHLHCIHFIFSNMVRS